MSDKTVFLFLTAVYLIKIIKYQKFFLIILFRFLFVRYTLNPTPKFVNEQKQSYTKININISKLALRKQIFNLSKITYIL